MLWLNHGWNITNLLAQVNIGVSDSVINLISLIISLAIYVFTSYCFYNIYQKLGEPNAWFAWVPILQNWIMYKAGDQSPWWLIGLFIPLVNIVAAIFLIIAFVNIIKKLGKNPWLILLMIVPIVNFVLLYNFAFG
ncbi:DUF5684 domain-containing protein [Calothrix rhizosoleniae]|uniref:DUF5684 domain-containing protein n=1 Tax=Calothrix rhizosoleniae TaxID=888997 RepID=UPI000B49C13C|nr:DUF5684 domain-containing protein [Calothrix rhizosoleniae]